MIKHTVLILLTVIVASGCTPKKERPRDPMTGKVVYQGCQDICEDVSSRKEECREAIVDYYKALEFPPTVVEKRIDPDMQPCMSTCYDMGREYANRQKLALQQTECRDFAGYVQLRVDRICHHPYRSL